jgi:hypothetical protein
MLLSNFIDLLTRLQSALYSDEQESLYAQLDSIDELYKLRRCDIIEQRFWNDFWHKWNFPRLRDAYQQAFRDMADDPTIPSINRGEKLHTDSYRNFERAVSSDVFKFRRHLLSLLSLDCPNLSQEVFFNLQAQVQEYYENNYLPLYVVKKARPAKKVKHPPVTKEEYASMSVAERISKAIQLTKQQRLEKKLKKKLHQQFHYTPTEIPQDQSLIEPKPKTKQQKKNDRPYCRLMITTPTGEIIETGNSNFTFLEFVMRAGWENVKALNLSFEEEPLFCNTQKNGWYKEVTPGVYLYCKMNCERKIEYINQICNSLGLSYIPSMTEPLER